VAREKGLLSSWACIAWYIEFHAVISMLTAVFSRLRRVESIGPPMIPHTTDKT
jgi:hypothetical protein